MAEWNYLDIKIRDDYPEHISRISLFMALFVCGYLYSYKTLAVLCGFAAGATISIVMFNILVWSIRQFVSRDTVNGAKNYYSRLIVFFTKYLLLCILLFLLFRHASLNIAAFSAGIGFVQIIMILNGLGLILMSYAKTKPYSKLNNIGIN